MKDEKNVFHLLSLRISEEKTKEKMQKSLFTTNFFDFRF